MNAFLQRRVQRYLSTVVLIGLLVLAFAPALAGPGAHGPNGEHLDDPNPMRPASALPRIEAHSEAFELVAELRTGELAIVVDRYASNEPVLGAKLEVESGPLKAVAAFRAEQGDYAVTDGALLKALATIGEHGLVFTLVAGQESDLLDGTLVNAAGGVAGRAVKGGHPHDHGSDGHGHDQPVTRAAWIGAGVAAGVAALGLLGGLTWLRQRRRNASNPQGAL